MNVATPPESITSGSVVVVGEYTTPSGPVADDHFVVAVLRSGKLIELPSDKADQTIADLEKATGIKIELRLCNRTDAASRIIFPAALEGKPLFNFSRSSAGFLKPLKLLRSFGVSEISAELTDEVREFVARSAIELSR